MRLNLSFVRSWLVCHPGNQMAASYYHGQCWSQGGSVQEQREARQAKFSTCTRRLKTLQRFKDPWNSIFVGHPPENASRAGVVVFHFVMAAQVRCTARGNEERINSYVLKFELFSSHKFLQKFLSVTAVHFERGGNKFLFCSRSSTGMHSLRSGCRGCEPVFVWVHARVVLQTRKIRFS